MELADPAVTYLVAETGGAAFAYAMLRLGAVPDEVRGPHPIEVVRFYVDHGHHGTGAAQSLMHAVEEAARNQGRATLWLGVWEHNPRAIAFYRKLGFVDVGSHEFVLGTDRQVDRLMARTLSK